MRNFYREYRPPVSNQGSVVGYQMGYLYGYGANGIGALFGESGKVVTSFVAKAAVSLYDRTG